MLPERLARQSVLAKWSPEATSQIAVPAILSNQRVEIEVLISNSGDKK
jgi:hypothetical protein